MNQLSVVLRMHKGHVMLVAGAKAVATGLSLVITASAARLTAATPSVLMTVGQSKRGRVRPKLLPLLASGRRSKLDTWGCLTGSIFHAWCD